MRKVGTFILNSLFVKIFRPPYNPAIVLLVICPREMKTYVHIKMFLNVLEALM